MAGCGAWPWYRRNQLHTHDVNGDGMTDLIRIDPGDWHDDGGNVDPEEWEYWRLYYSIWINKDGHHFERLSSNREDKRFVLETTQPGYLEDIQGRSVGGAPVYMYSDARIAFADMNGSGTEDLVVIYHDGIQFVDFGGNESGLLTDVSNGYGKHTTYGYDNLQQLAVGKNWETKVERIIPVVTSRTESVDGPGFVSRSLRTTYEYENPAYDSWQHRLVGFSKVVERPENGPVTVRGYKFSPCETSTGCTNPGQTSDDDFVTAISGKPTYELISDGTSTVFPYGKVLSKSQTSFEVFTTNGLDGRKSWAALPSASVEYLYDPTEPQSVSWEDDVFGQTSSNCAGCTTSYVSAMMPSFGGTSTKRVRTLYEHGEYGTLTAQHEYGSWSCPCKNEQVGFRNLS